jgi:hypothetical protein
MTKFTIQIFANPTPDPTGHGQGKTLVATVTLTTGPTGNGSVTLTVPQNLAGQYLTATATDSSGDTSEFGRDMQVVGRTTAQPSLAGGSVFSQPVSVSPAPGLMIAPAQADLVGAKVEVGQANGAGLIQGLPQRLADAVFQTWHDEWDARVAHATTQQAKQQPHLPRQGADDAGPGEGLDSWFDAVWKDFAQASS